MNNIITIDDSSDSDATEYGVHVPFASLVDIDGYLDEEKPTKPPACPSPELLRSNDNPQKFRCDGRSTLRASARRTDDSRLVMKVPPKLPRGEAVLEVAISNYPREQERARRATEVRMARDAYADVDWKSLQSQYKLFPRVASAMEVGAGATTRLYERPQPGPGALKTNGKQVLKKATLKTNSKQPLKKRGKLVVDEKDDSEDDCVSSRRAGFAPKLNGKQPLKKRTKLIGASNSDDEKDSDFTPPSLDLTQPSLIGPQRRSSRELSLSYLLESTHCRWNLPRPSIRDPPARTARSRLNVPEDAELVPASWPYSVMHLADYFNPGHVRVPGEEPFQKCYCVLDCRAETCVTAKTGFFCDEWSCRHEGLCGNGTRTHQNVRLMRVKNTDIFTLQAASLIPCGVVLGEYLGILSLVPGEKDKREKNEGFRLHFKKNPDLWGSRDLCVDAKVAGSLMRFLNHSCAPSARFQEHTNVGGRTMVVVTVRTIRAGEEITVDYGHDLWFDCQCLLCLNGESTRKKLA